MEVDKVMYMVRRSIRCNICMGVRSYLDEGSAVAMTVRIVSVANAGTEGVMLGLVRHRNQKKAVVEDGNRETEIDCVWTVFLPLLCDSKNDIKG